MGIDRLNSAAWAAGFAMAPTEDDAVKTASAEVAVEDEARVRSGWRSAKVPSALDFNAAQSSMRQWLSSWQRKATA